MNETGQRMNITDAVGVARALAQLRRMPKMLRRLGKAPDTGFDPLQDVEEALDGLTPQQWTRRANDKLTALLVAVAEAGPSAVDQVGGKAQTLLADFRTHLGRRVYVTTADDGDRDFQSALAHARGWSRRARASSCWPCPWKRPCPRACLDAGQTARWRA